MTFCLIKSSEKSKNSLIRGVINPVFQNLKIFLNKGGVIHPGGFILRSGVHVDTFDQNFLIYLEKG